MSLTPGMRLGPYEVAAQIGEGGMGAVYRARDTRLDRTVAIKVLPDALAADPQFRDRFDREARTISQLDHPHICALYDVGEQQGTAYLVMQYLEGETLADRLAKGTLPLDQALQVATQIADALAAAHKAGIVHRDLKPGNIMLTKSGAKLLDFGLAKARPAGLSGTNPSMLPTTPPITQQGAILGTFQYMAPEQLDGQEADTRTDIFAFGVLLYEMVTGRKAFEGKSQAGLIHAIMGAEPGPVSAIAPVAPRALDHLVARCLAKDPDDRWQTARDVHQELRWVHGELSVAEDATPVAARAARGRGTIAWVGLASLVAGAAVTAVVLRFGTGASAPPAVTRLQAARTPAVSSVGPQLHQVAISQDGRTLAFVGRLPNGTNGIFVRPLSAESATLVAGSETSATFAPAFSPDGKWIAFRNLQELFKVPVGGGRPTPLARFGSAVDGERLSWSADDWIYYTEATGQASASLLRVRASGGQPERLTTTTGGSLTSPQAVGGGRFVIFVDNGRDSDAASTSRIKLLDTQTRETRVLLDMGGASPTVTASGHLLFVRDGSLFAVPVDQDRLTVTGTPLEVLDGVQFDPSSGAAQYAVAANGTLLYQGGAAPGTTLMWADARGALRAFPAERIYYDPRLSPDGQAVAAEVLGDGDDIWVLDLTRGTQTKLSLGSAEDETPAWSPDGRWVAWSTTRDALRVILRKRADGSGQEEVLWSGPEHAHVTAFAPGGQSLLFEKQTVERNTDIWLLPLDGSGKERLVVGTAFNEVGARLSPDGRWLAYFSDETGIPQVYVQPYPTLDARFLISNSGGSEPVWSRDGRRLFYRVDGVLWSTSIAPGGTFKAGIPERLFDGRAYQGKAVTHTGYDVGPDGRFLVIGNSSPQAELLTVVQGWFEELKRLVPVN